MHQITINLLPNKIYPRLKRQGLEIGNSLGHDLSLKHGDTVVNRTAKIINDLGPCVGFVAFTPKMKFGAHSAPEIDNNPTNIKNFISKKIDELRANSRCQDEDVSAVIYGGIAYDESNNLSENSCKLVDAIEEGCRLEGVNPTIITGQYGDGLDTRINSFLGYNQITLWGKLIDKIKASHNATQTEILKILEEFFEYVKIPQNTKLNVLEDLPFQVRHLVK